VNDELACGRDPLVDAIVTFLTHGHASGVADLRTLLERTIDEAGPDAIGSLSTRLRGAGADWSYYPRDPLVRRIHHLLAPGVLRHNPIIAGTGHLAARAPVVSGGL
jgi:hypothetical protein